MDDKTRLLIEVVLVVVASFYALFNSVHDRQRDEAIALTKAIANNAAAEARNADDRLADFQAAANDRLAELGEPPIAVNPKQ